MIYLDKLDASEDSEDVIVGGTHSCGTSQSHPKQQLGGNLLKSKLRYLTWYLTGYLSYHLSLDITWISQQFIMFTMFIALGYSWNSLIEPMAVSGCWISLSADDCGDCGKLRLGPLMDWLLATTWPSPYHCLNISKRWATETRASQVGKASKEMKISYSTHAAHNSIHTV